MKIGSSAPDFTLKDGDGRDWKLSERRGKTVVLLFYPGDDTPVCTKQMCSVRDNWAEYAATGAEVIGISTDSQASHKNFADKYDLPLTLLADENGAVAKSYDANSWLPGRAARGVVVIDKAGVVRLHQIQPLSIFRPKDDEILGAIRKANDNNG
ncbi:MAG: peroxiredoxin [Acidobacteria bacterium]|nr:peroxiredoxin [Acidobacteriota bacterium]